MYSGDQDQDDEDPELVDQLPVILIGPNRSGATRQLVAAGHSEDDERGAWNFARARGLHGGDRPGNGPGDAGGKSPGHRDPRRRPVIRIH